MRYSFIIQNDNFDPNINRGLDYFYILESTGLVYLKQPLYTDALETSRFTVSFFCFCLIVKRILEIKNIVSFEYST